MGVDLKASGSCCKGFRKSSDGPLNQRIATSSDSLPVVSKQPWLALPQGQPPLSSHQAALFPSMHLATREVQVGSHSKLALVSAGEETCL